MVQELLKAVSEMLGEGSEGQRYPIMKGNGTATHSNGTVTLHKSLQRMTKPRP